MAATRLARTRSTVATVLDEYIQSNVTIRAIIQRVEPIAKDNQRYLYERQRSRFQLTSLFEVNS